VSEAGPRRRGASRVLMGLVAGAALGVAGHALLGEDHPALAFAADSVAAPIGQAFLRLLFMVVVPLVFSSLLLGVAGLGDLRRLGRLGLRTLLLFLLTTALAAVIGITLVNAFRPGDQVDPAQVQRLVGADGEAARARLEQARAGTGFGVETLVNIVPRNLVDSAARNDMLGVIFFALMAGIACALLPSDRTQAFRGFLEGLVEVCGVLIRMAMRIAPLGVGALIFAATARCGPAILRALAAYVGLVLAGLVIHQFIVLGALVRVGAGLRPAFFFRRARTLMATAFATSSSSATLPTTLRTAVSEFGVPAPIAGFVLPLGATMNMNGTALFEGFSVLFLAQVAGVDLDFGTQALVVGLAVLTAIGAAGVPGGSLPLLALVLERVGVPAETLGLILGVDRIVDMARTVPNVTGDLAVSLVVARAEGAWSPPADG
jgi:DAACS family dicarboxylate/amino acid:cation (Na+ or H+) symporter